MAQSIYNIMQEASDRAATEAAFVSALGMYAMRHCIVLCVIAWCATVIQSLCVVLRYTLHCDVASVVLCCVAC